MKKRKEKLNIKEKGSSKQNYLIFSCTNLISVQKRNTTQIYRNYFCVRTSIVTRNLSTINDIIKYNQIVAFLYSQLI